MVCGGTATGWPNVQTEIEWMEDEEENQIEPLYLLLHALFLKIFKIIKTERKQSQEIQVCSITNLWQTEIKVNI